MTVDGNGIVDAPITLFVSEMECITCQTPPSNTDATVSSIKMAFIPPSFDTYGRSL